MLDSPMFLTELNSESATFKTVDGEVAVITRDRWSEMGRPETVHVVIGVYDDNLLAEAGMR